MRDSNSVKKIPCSSLWYRCTPISTGFMFSKLTATFVLYHCGLSSKNGYKQCSTYWTNRAFVAVGTRIELANLRINEILLCENGWQTTMMKTMISLFGAYNVILFFRKNCYTCYNRLIYILIQSGNAIRSKITYPYISKNIRAGGADSRSWQRNKSSDGHPPDPLHDQHCPNVTNMKLNF